MLRIDVANRHAVGKIHRLRTYGVPAVPCANAAENRPVIFGLCVGVLADQGRFPGEIRHGSRTGYGGRFKKLATRGIT
jgi:hypothetical protein